MKPKRSVADCAAWCRRDYHSHGEVSLRALRSYANFKGYESFNDALEVLKMLKGGFSRTEACKLFTSWVDHVMRANGCQLSNGSTSTLASDAGSAQSMVWLHSIRMTTRQH